MINLIKFLVFLILSIYSKNIVASEDKVIFILDNEIFTSLDFEKRKKYIQLKNSDMNLLNDELIKKDFISSLLFKKKSENLNIRINKLIIEQFYNSFFKKYEDENLSNKFKEIFKEISYDQIIEFLEIDISRKMILENYINTKKDEINREGNIINEEDIYNIKIEYYSFDKKNSDLMSKNFLEIDFNNKKKTNEILSLNKINYIYENKNISDLKKLSKNIKKAIKDKNKLFKINTSNNLIIGQIVRTIINEEVVNVDLFKIITLEKEIDKNLIKCENMNKLLNKKNVKIEKFENIQYKKLNKNIKKNLLVENDFIIINKKNIEYIILCNIKFNKDNYVNIKKEKLVNKFLDDFEIEFIKENTKNYNFILYEK